MYRAIYAYDSSQQDADQRGWWRCPQPAIPSHRHRGLTTIKSYKMNFNYVIVLSQAQNDTVHDRNASSRVLPKHEPRCNPLPPTDRYTMQESIKISVHAAHVKLRHTVEHSSKVSPLLRAHPITRAPVKAASYKMSGVLSITSSQHHWMWSALSLHLVLGRSMVSNWSDAQCGNSSAVVQDAHQLQDSPLMGCKYKCILLL